jgi:transposase
LDLRRPRFSSWFSTWVKSCSVGVRAASAVIATAMNAIFSSLRTGCPWRYLPGDEFPPRSTVCNIFRKFQTDGVWEAIREELHVTLREQLGRQASPTAAVIASQTLKAAEVLRKTREGGFDGEVGYDAGNPSMNSGGQGAQDSCPCRLPISKCVALAAPLP